MSEQSAHIFINYRRPGGRELANTLKSLIDRNFGEGTAFLDSASTESGTYWEKHIEQQLKNARLVIAVVHGQDFEWFTVTKGEFGERRLFQEEDWVRKELAWASEKGIPIIPLKLQEAKWPEEAQRAKAAPPELQAFLALQWEGYDGDEAEASQQKLVLRIKELLPELTATSSKLIETAEENPLAHLPLPPKLIHDICFLEAPYLGPMHFEAKDAPLFFGREQDILQVYNELLQLEQSQVLLLYGASGVGKSSLLHAGLFPRLAHQQWAVSYKRRNKAKGMAQQLQEGIEQLKQSEQPYKLLLLDQVEEILTDPQPNNPAEWSDFFALLARYSQEQQAPTIMLSFRKEYLADVRDVLREQKLSYRWYSLQPLKEKGIRKAIRGAFESPAVRDGFGLGELEKKLEDSLVHDILQDYKSNIAPLLQYQLRTLWDRAKQGQPEGTIALHSELYERERQSSLKDFLEKEKLAAIAVQFPHAAQNGLLNDVLYFYTTAEYTSAQRSIEGYAQRYRHLPKEEIVALHQALVNAYILVYTDEKRTSARLAHDALARIVRQRFERSDQAGQQAWAVLQAFRRAKRKQTQQPAFSEAQLQIVEGGRKGMPTLEEVVEKQLQTEAALYLQRRKERYTLAMEKAQGDYEHLRFSECLKHLQLALDAGWQEGEAAIVALARQLPYPLELLSLEEAKAACAKLLERLGATPLSEKERDDLQARFFPQMIEIQGGKYTRGDVMGDNLYTEERPVHEVALSNYSLGATPVTCWQYGLYCLLEGLDLPNDSGFGRSDRPVININWHEAAAYCNWLSRYWGMEEVYEFSNGKVESTRSEAVGCRLPTEAQWEYAAREGGKKVRFGNGQNEISYKSMNYDVQHEYNQKYASAYTEATEEKAHGKTTPVKKYAPNALGLYDMSGNVYEWCSDWYDEQYYQSLEGKLSKDPVGPQESPGGYRVVRGGSWYLTSIICRCSYRYRLNPINRNNNTGFRISGR